MLIFFLRLCGPRGLKCLHEHFDKFKPKGEGHEVIILTKKGKLVAFIVSLKYLYIKVSRPGNYNE